MATALHRHLNELAQGDHVCPIQDNVVEQLAVVVLFILEGLARGERCIYVAHEPEIKDAINGLVAALLDVGRERKQGSLVLLSDRDAYLRSGEFRPDEMIDFISKSEDKAIADGFASLRFTGDMSWVLEGGIDGDLLIDYEARLNAFLAQSRSVILCHYLRSRFDSALLHDVLFHHDFSAEARSACPPTCQNAERKPSPCPGGHRWPGDLYAREHQAPRVCRATSIGTSSVIWIAQITSSASLMSMYWTSGNPRKLTVSPAPAGFHVAFRYGASI
jgi:hypothetical protein